MVAGRRDICGMSAGLDCCKHLSRADVVAPGARVDGRDYAGDWRSESRFHFHSTDDEQRVSGSDRRSRRDADLDNRAGNRTLQAVLALLDR
jgi:hypothetical protein